MLYLVDYQLEVYLEYKMAIVGITPTFMSPIAFRDSAQQLAQQSKENAAALQNALKFGTQVYDYVKNRQIGDALKKEDADTAALLESQKINQQDPSVLWRWYQGQQLQKDQIAAAEKRLLADEKKAQRNLLNETQAILNNVTSNNPEAMAQYINNLNTQKAKLQNAGLNTDAIDAKIAEVTGNMTAAQQNIAVQLAEEKAVKESANHRDTALKLASEDAMNYLASYGKYMADADKQMVQQYIKNKESEERGKRQSDISRDQSFSDEQKKKARRTRWQ